LRKVLVATVGAPETVPLNGSDDVVRARHRVRDRATELGFDLVAQTRIVTATSELARNTHLHGGGGQLTISQVEDGRRRGLRLEFADSGPGIPDVRAALTDGWSSGGGLGLGLGGTKRLVDEFSIESAPGRGTRVEVVQWLKRR
jgi:serine/threonine-protein kinase RsbT